LASVTIGNLYVVGQNYTVNATNTSNGNWAIWLRQVDAKALTGGANSSYNFSQPSAVTYYNNYAISFTSGNDTGVPQLRAYQQPLTGGAAVPRLNISSNTNANFTPALVAAALIGKTFYIFHSAAENKINVTNFVIGASNVGTNEFTLSSNYSSGLSAVWGEALGSNQVIATWLESGVQRDATVDVVKGTVKAQNVGAFDSSYVCRAYATDKKWFGELCSQTNATAGTVNYFVRTNTTSLASLANYTTNTSTLSAVYPYGQYLAIVFADGVTAAPSQSYNYELWNLDTLTLFKNRTQFLTIDTNSTSNNYRVPSGGLYTIVYNNRQQLNGTLTGVSVGLLLGSSYLASVFGFLLTIIAGLFLF